MGSFSAIVYLATQTGRILQSEFVSVVNKDAGPANLMDPVRRSSPFAVDATAVAATLEVEISEPTTFKIGVFGPLSHVDQARLVESEITVLPGVNIGTPGPDGLATVPEGLVLEVPGLCVSDITNLSLSGTVLSCQATVTMMCGCKIGEPTQPAPPELPWPWPWTDFKIQLVTRMTSGMSYYYPMPYLPNGTAPSSHFGDRWDNQAKPADGPIVQAWVSASQPSLGNQGSYQVYPRTPVRPLPSHLQAMLEKEGMV